MKSRLILSLAWLLGVTFPTGIVLAENAFQVAVPLSGDRADAIVYQPRISGDGSVIAFLGAAANFIEGESTELQVLLYNRASNALSVGSFGEGVFKVGMTRRLEPMVGSTPIAHQASHRSHLPSSASL